jgi:cystathionine gamma-synthase
MRDPSPLSKSSIDRRGLHFDTLAAHSAVADSATGALTPPIHLSTTFERDDEGISVGDYVYGRSNNPNRAMLEHSLAELEGGEVGIAFASGSAATLAVLLCLNPGDHVIAPASSYYAVREQLRTIFARWGLGFTFVDMSRLDDLEQALARPTKLVWIESPSNPLIAVTDIAAAAWR